MGQTMIYSTHFFRRSARAVERDLQEKIRAGVRSGRPFPDRIPEWARGARVVPAGLFQHAVEITSWVGH